MLKTYLCKGKPVQYRSFGDELWPNVRSGDCCLWEPVFNSQKLKEGDIVFCELQPGINGDRFLAQKIMLIEAEPAEFKRGGVRRFVFGGSEYRPSARGWCHDHHVFGRLVEVLH